MPRTMGALAVGALAGLALAGCLREKVPYCDNGAYCPEPLACTERSDRFCGPAFEVAQCLAMPEEAPCQMTAASASNDGYCDRGICTACDANNAACSYEGWAHMQTGTVFDLYAGSAIADRQLYAGGKSGTILVWEGRSWTPVPPPVEASAADFRGVYARGSDDLFAVAGSSVYRRQGDTWAKQAPAQLNPLLSISGGASTDVVVTGFNGTIGRYTTAWTYSETTGGAAVVLGASWAASKTDGFAVGASGTVLHFDGTWTSQRSTANQILHGVWGTAGDNVYAVGQTASATPILLHRDGTGWTDVTSALPPTPAGTILYGVWGTSASSIFAVGSLGTILHYDGVSWTAMQSSTTTALRAVFGFAKDVFVVGDGGTVLRYRDE